MSVDLSPNSYPQRFLHLQFPPNVHVDWQVLPVCHILDVCHVKTVVPRGNVLDSELHQESSVTTITTPSECGAKSVKCWFLWEFLTLWMPAAVVAGTLPADWVAEPTGHLELLCIGDQTWLPGPTDPSAPRPPTLGRNPRLHCATIWTLARKSDSLPKPSTTWWPFRVHQFWKENLVLISILLCVIWFQKYFLIYVNTLCNHHFLRISIFST